MIALILVILFGLIFCLLIPIYYEGISDGRQLASAIFGAISLILILMFFQHEVTKLMDESKTEFVQDYKYDMLALNDSKDINGQLSGSIFATRGYINTEVYYYFVINTIKGKYMSKELASQTYIDEKENVKPNIYCGYYIWPDKNFWRDIFYGLEIRRTHECYMTVPSGTITDNYIIDLQ